MLERLHEKNLIDVYDFLNQTYDKFEDFYLTFNKERKFLKGNLKLIKKTLKSQEVYGLFNKDLKGILILVREKGFRPYLKILTKSTKFNIDFLKWVKWNFSEIDLYCKFKIENPLSKQIINTGFSQVGFRGKELLFFKKGIKNLYKFVPKDLSED